MTWIYGYGYGGAKCHGALGTAARLRSTLLCSRITMIDTNECEFSFISSMCNGVQERCCQVDPRDRMWPAGV